MHIVTMEVHALGTSPLLDTKIATATIDSYATPQEAEAEIERINRGEHHKQNSLERLKAALRKFYGSERMLVFVYTKKQA